MEYWQILLIVGLICLILELFAPLTFFLSMSIGSFIAAIVAVWFSSWNVLIPVFAVSSILSLIVFRPFLAKNMKTSKETETGVNAQYVGKTAKVISQIDKFSGAISIYDERWEARAISDVEIPVGCEVKIVKNDSLVMYVEKR